MDNQLAVTTQNLPANLWDLAKFVLIGRDRLKAVCAEIHAIDKVGLAKAVRDQKLHEAQDIAEAVLDAEKKVGELMAKVPKRQGFASAIHDNGVANAETKETVIERAGFTPKQVQRFETLAAHPEIVEQAKAEAREKDEIVTRKSVLDKIRKEKEAVQDVYDDSARETSEPRKNFGNTSEGRMLRKEIQKAYEPMRNYEAEREYTIDDLIEEVQVNGERYIEQLHRTLEIHNDVMRKTDEGLTAVQNAINKIMRDIREEMPRYEEQR